MSSWTAQRVLDAPAEMEWVPEGAIELRADDYRLIRYPDVVLDPTFRAASAVTVQGWERAEPDDVELAHQYQEAIGDLATWSSFRVVRSWVTSPSRPVAAWQATRRPGNAAVLGLPMSTCCGSVFFSEKRSILYLKRFSPLVQ